jgi:FxsC-like protein
MAYEFFLSYTRANNDAFLKMFFEELSKGIRDLRGLGKDAEVGFFDQQDLELGEQWDAAIVDALQTSRVFVAVTSPGYFKSEYCGKEWAVFRQRLMASGVQPLPPLIKPVVWIPSKIDTLSTAVTAGQLTFGDPHAVQNTRGFKFLLKNLQAQQLTFNELIDTLAQEICDAADAYHLPPLNGVPQLSGAASAFTHAVAAPAPTTPTGPKHVRFVYVAADPNAFGTARMAEPYADAGGPDWKPYFPHDKTRIHLFAQHLASSNPLGFTSEELRFSSNLLAEIDDAWAKRQIVVLIVDGWTVQWSAQYRAILSQLDGRLDYHWCVLVPRNDADQDAAAVRVEIETAMSQTFDKHANLARNPLFYRDNISTAAELKQQLTDVLTRLKEEIKKRAEVTMPVPAGPSRAILAGPASQV